MQKNASYPDLYRLKMHRKGDSEQAEKVDFLSLLVRIQNILRIRVPIKRIK